MRSIQIFILFATVVSICSSAAHAQVFYNTEKSDSTSVYQKALNELKVYIKEAFPKVKEIVLEKTLITTTWITLEDKEFKVIILPESQIDSELKRRKGTLYYTRVVPLRLKNGIFVVNIGPFKVERAGRYVNSGGLEVRFKYDCDNNKLSYVGVDGGFQNLE